MRLFCLYRPSVGQSRMLGLYAFTLPETVARRELRRLRDPNATGIDELWQYAAAHGPVVPIHLSMLSIGHEALMEYPQRKDRFRRREAIYRRSERRGGHYRNKWHIS